MSCQTCHDYCFVPIDKGDELMPCPDCTLDGSVTRCPVHNQLVVLSNGRLAGKCWGCTHEAADGLQWLRAHPVAA